ncbi:MAG: nucleotide pyrophosphohydrolase [Candidatus Heimdallarchaeota archaeon]|nr:nucleotide pyrophosphohydrolase [Candidatus Heimdallarchaeota archaeon]
MPEDIFNNLKTIAKEFSTKRNWLKYHNPKSLSMAITIESAELMEIFQWWTNEESTTRSMDPNIKIDIEGEVADIMIYILHLANTLNINLEDAVKSKLEFNEMRFTDEVVSSLETNNFIRKNK